MFTDKIRNLLSKINNTLDNIDCKQIEKSAKKEEKQILRNIKKEERLKIKTEKKFIREENKQIFKEKIELKINQIKNFFSNILFSIKLYFSDKKEEKLKIQAENDNKKTVDSFQGILLNCYYQFGIKHLYQKTDYSYFRCSNLSEFNIDEVITFYIKENHEEIKNICVTNYPEKLEFENSLKILATLLACSYDYNQETFNLSRLKTLYNLEQKNASINSCINKYFNESIGCIEEYFSSLFSGDSKIESLSKNTSFVDEIKYKYQNIIVF